MFTLTLNLIMQFGMFTDRQYLQVLNTVIRLIFIFVVNRFIAIKLSTQVHFHHMTVLQFQPVIHGDDLISIRAKISGAIKCTFPNQRIAVLLEQVKMISAQSFSFVLSRASLKSAMRVIFEDVQGIAMYAPSFIMCLTPLALTSWSETSINGANFTRERRRASFGLSHMLNSLSVCG